MKGLMIGALAQVVLVGWLPASCLAGPTFPLIVAQAGFNDQTGVNGDLLADSPYKLNATVVGRGGGEPGWGGNTWTTYPSDGRGMAVANGPYEGDGCLRVSPQNQYGERSWVARKWENALSTPFLIEHYLRFSPGSAMHARYFSPTGGFYGNCGPIWWGDGNRFYVADGDGRGGWTKVDTGFTLQPMQWYKVSMLVDPVDRTFEFSVDDVTYSPASPLKFVGSVNSLQYLAFDAGTETWVDGIRISTVPEPSTFTLLGIGAIGMFAMGWRQRRRPV